MFFPKSENERVVKRECVGVFVCLHIMTVPEMWLVIKCKLITTVIWTAQSGAI